MFEKHVIISHKVSKLSHDLILDENGWIFRLFWNI